MVSLSVTTISRFELILLLMAVVLALELVARRIRMPPAAAFILGGIALALIPGTPDCRRPSGCGSFAMFAAMRRASSDRLMSVMATAICRVASEIPASGSTSMRFHFRLNTPSGTRAAMS